MTLQPIWITDDAPVHAFPDVEYALTQPNGLLAVGGDLSPARLMHAYRRGIFPWFSDGQPILWWAPDPRAVLFPEDLRVSRSLGKTIRRQVFEVRFDTAFDEVIRACAAPRARQNDTWITGHMIRAYRELHALGHAHCVETWQGDRLLGGLYGVAIGGVFFGESMFSRESDASKVALHALCRQGYRLVDCQLPSAHLTRLGATSVPRASFTRMLARWCELPRVELPVVQRAGRPARA
ncbi:MAG: leucyl/phenylalanyl-tRNA--protein transferase [Gammaproteobacteria bacterium]|nr:leucyl/phenylalanyl-tRNA--protein transferase [Gammaproteobacteria bacterium]